MKTAALISGGKDSCFNLMCCIAEGHDVVALANLRPVKKDELDSYMFQTVGHHAIDLYAEALDLPLFTQNITGTSLSTGRDYQPQEGDEVEDLYTLLSHVKAEMGIEAVSVGAILSDYQRIRVENVCQRLNLVALSFLWRRNQADLLKEMIDCGVKAILIKVAALGLDPNRHLGLQLPEIYPHMLKMRSQYGLNECGEGGEYETFVFDSPVFKKAIVIDEVEKVIHSDDAFAPVGYLNLKRCHLHEKKWDSTIPLRDQVLQLPIKTSRKSYPPSFSPMPHIDPPQYTVAAQNEELPSRYCTNGKSFQISGIRPLVVKGEDISSVAARAMNELSECVDRMGHSRADITSVSLCVENMADFAAINAVYKTFFGINPPIRVCVQGCLPPNAPLQLDCQGKRCEAASDRRTMHVQALSHWAPANIGPYSQAVWVDDIVYLAGIVPLVPATLNLVEGDAIVQCRTALSHVAKVLSAICPGADLSHCPLVICYLTAPEHVPTARAALRDARSELPTMRLPLTVQFCIVPSLPKAALVEWKVFAWPLLESEQDTEVTCTTHSSEDYSLSLFTLRHKAKPDQMACHITLDLMTQREEPLPAVGAVVENLAKLYTQTLLQYPAQQMPSLATVFYVHSAFQYSELRQCFDQFSSSFGEQQFCVSLVPVLQLGTPQQLMAWCQ